MKKGWKIAVAVDGILVAILLAAMVWFNSRPSHGVAALEDMGAFVLCLAAFQLALAVLLVLVIAALVVRYRQHRK